MEGCNRKEGKVEAMKKSKYHIRQITKGPVTALQNTDMEKYNPSREHKQDCKNQGAQRASALYAEDQKAR